MNNGMNNLNNNMNNQNTMYNQQGVGVQPQQPMMQPQMNYQQTPVYQQPQPPIKKKNDLLVVFIVIGVVIAILIAIILLVFSNSNDKDKENNNDNNVVVENQDDKNEQDDNDNDNETDEQPENDDNNINDEQDDDSNDINDDAATSLPSDWKSMQFIFDGNKYTLISPYATFKNNGWELDLNKLGKPDGYIVKPNTRVLSTVQLYNSKYSDSWITVGFINSGSVDKDITECDVWSFGVRNTYSKSPISFELPGGIKNGSTHAEVEAAYGKLEEKDMYRSESLKYTTYNYNYDLNKYLKLTVYDDGGLKEFSYQIYR